MTEASRTPDSIILRMSAKRPLHSVHAVRCAYETDTTNDANYTRTCGTATRARTLQAYPQAARADACMAYRKPASNSFAKLVRAARTATCYAPQPAARATQRGTTAVAVCIAAAPTAHTSATAAAALAAAPAAAPRPYVQWDRGPVEATGSDIPSVSQECFVHLSLTITHIAFLLQSQMLSPAQRASLALHHPQPVQYTCCGFDLCHKYISCFVFSSGSIDSGR